MSADFDIVIVGGGAAGVGAARRLAGSGLTTLLLEAGSRLGGRAWTQEIRGLELDLGCGWLHSAERNSWAAIAQASGVPVDESRAAWGVQYKDLGFPAAEQAEAWRAFDAWTTRLRDSPPASDRAADALEPQGRWNAHIRAIVGFISGARLEQLSAADYVAYDEASTEANWRLRSGLGALVARSFPREVALRLATPVESIALIHDGVRLTTATGAIRARAAVLTVSSGVLAGDSIELPAELEPWREAARQLPLGLNEKLFLEIIADAPFEPETHVTGNPRDASTASYYIRPFGWPVIECFFGGERAHLLCEHGLEAGFSFAMDQIAGLFGAGVRKSLRPLTASHWSRSKRVGGAYSYALPGQKAARNRLALPFEKRVFFAGEATHGSDFSTAHGAHDSGTRAATEVIAALKN
ncbi:MAG TPA: NAD(P)/FAD-dependent oxidoreductase [Steroidobacteraceae bacterium]|nr:NAD(P)/FAD-dependent oxidoreductase [Steroidobacteraceae bacterium]